MVNVKKQVVAGTNYNLTLKLETNSGQICSKIEQKLCENIIVYKPLPIACSSQDGCLELIQQEQISCKGIY